MGLAVQAESKALLMHVRIWWFLEVSVRSRMLIRWLGVGGGGG